MQKEEPTAQAPLLFAMLDIRLGEKLDSGVVKPNHPILLFITDGNGRLETNGASPALLEGGCFLLAAGVPYEIRSEAGLPLHGYELLFETFRIGRPCGADGLPIRAEAGFPHNVEVYGQDQPKIGEMIRSLYNSRGIAGEREQFNRQRLFLELLDRLWELSEKAGREEKPAAKSAVERTIAFMEEAYDQDLTRDRLAEIAGMSRDIGVVWKTNDYNWSPDFREAVGVKPGQKVVGTLHMGYFDKSKVRRPKPRTPASDLLILVD